MPDPRHPFDHLLSPQVTTPRPRIDTRHPSRRTFLMAGLGAAAVAVPVTLTLSMPDRPSHTTATPRTARPTTPVTPNTNYSRSAAVSWALAHAYDPQPYSAMSTWFVSNALWAGGLPRDATWTDQGHYESAPGTKTAWLLPDFLNYFRSQYSTTLTQLPMSAATNAVPTAEPGDLIIYDWGQGQQMSHISLVADITSGQYPEVTEMGQYNDNMLQAGRSMTPQTSTYQRRGWTWSEANHGWLQQKYPKVKAYLLHINGGNFTPG
jgi:hypothetical protein